MEFELSPEVEEKRPKSIIQGFIIIIRDLKVLFKAFCFNILKIKFIKLTKNKR